VIQLIRVALVGVGYWGPKIAASMAKLENCQLVAVVDSSEKALRNLENLYSFGETRTFTSLEKLLNSDVVVDAVIIATPPATHEILTELCLHAGKHVLVEKPIFMNESKALELIGLAKRKSLLLMPGHTFLYNDAILWAKSYMDSGGLGKVLTAYSQRLNLGQLRADTNVLWSLAPHDISIFNFLLNSKPISISASGTSVVQSGILDFAHISLEYPMDLLINVHVSWLDPGKVRRVTLVGEKGMLVIDDSLPQKIAIHEKYIDRVQDKELGKDKIFLRDSKKTIEPMLEYREPLMMEIEDFARCIEEGTIPRATSMDGFAIARIINSSEESIAQDSDKIFLEWSTNESEN
jgi:predicted dehydrogenase